MFESVLNASWAVINEIEKKKEIAHIMSAKHTLMLILVSTYANLLAPHNVSNRCLQNIWFYVTTSILKVD